MSSACFANPFREEGSWFKGNVHTHTTNSDGILDLEQICLLYRSKGYDFICITDHNKATEVKQVSNSLKEEFLVMPGVEISVGRSEVGRKFHLAALNLDHIVECSDPQSTIDEVVNEGGEVLIGHPYWSSLTVNDLLKLEGYLGIEIFSSTSHFSTARGCSAIHWDDLLVRGRFTLGFAVDDAHCKTKPHRPIDACYAWITVKSKDLTAEFLMNAMRSGMFYSSTGPEIVDVDVKDGSVHVEASPASAINFIAADGRGERFTAVGKPVSEAEYRLRGTERYVRIEVEDGNGGTAWTNPIIFSEDRDVPCHPVSHGKPAKH